MAEILAEHSFSRYWAKVSGLMGLLKGRARVTSGAMKFCSCISPFCDAAHVWYGEVSALEGGISSTKPRHQPSLGN